MRSANDGSRTSPLENNPRRVGELIAAVERAIEVLDTVSTGTSHTHLMNQRFQFWSEKPKSSIAGILPKASKARQSD
ncbi:MAG: hypothetical protein ACR2JB_27845 [Bryobacteraceae bacterium]